VLPGLHDKLAASGGNGLYEYIAAIAIERIAKVGGNSSELERWDTAQQFLVKWDTHLRLIPSEVETISNDPRLQPEEQIRKLVELGTPALPFILDQIASGREQLVPAVLELTKDIPPPAAENNADIKAWATRHKNNLTSLQQYVLDQLNK